MPKIDLSNKKYEYYTVLNRNEELTRYNKKNVFWNCECCCGKYFTATTTDINKQKVKSCGCMSAKLISQAHLQDITGQVFGNLIVLERDYDYPQYGKKTRTMWKCQCLCGNIISVDRTHLVNRSQSSCGCKNSIGELKINQLLNNYNIKYKTQYTNSDLKTEKGGYLRFDFAILDNENNVVRLIEFDGVQHHKEIEFFNSKDLFIRDKIKNKYAREHQIPLVRIPYYKRDTLTIEDLLEDQFLV